MQMETRRIQFEVSWVPRDQNTEADAITNGDWSLLSKENQMATHLTKLPFLVLHELLERGERYYSDSNTAHLVGEDCRSLGADPPKVRDSWGK